MSSMIPGRRTYIAGCVILILFGSVHLVAVFFGPPTPEQDRTDQALRAHKIDMGPFHPTMRDAVQILSLGYSLFLHQAGILSLIAMRPASLSGRLRALTLANIVFAAISTGVCIYHQFPPPLVFSAAALVVFVVSYIYQGKRIHESGLPVVSPSSRS